MCYSIFIYKCMVTTVSTALSKHWSLVPYEYGTLLHLRLSADFCSINFEIQIPYGFPAEVRCHSKPLVAWVQEPKKNCSHQAPLLPLLSSPLAVVQKARRACFLAPPTKASPGEDQHRPVSTQRTPKETTGQTTPPLTCQGRGRHGASMYSM